MKKFNRFLSLFMLIVISACEWIPATGTPGDPEPPPAETDALVVTDVPAEATDIPTLVPVPLDLSGPPMEIGSMVTYIDGSTVLAVPGGEFVMGRGGEDNPEHRVSLSSFWLYRSKVTNSQYAFCVAQGKCSPPNSDQNPNYRMLDMANHPVVGVTYEQADAYCSFVNGHLPTEAQWEKAARGPDGNIYPWGDAAPSCALANFGDCKNQTTSVLEHLAGQSFYFALDMAGNTFEWVFDWYDPNYYSESPTEDPLGPDLGLRRTVRSSSFNSPGYETEVARRFSLSPYESRNDLGFRCIVEDPTYFAPYCSTALVYGLDAATGLPSGTAGSESCPQVDIVQYSYCNQRIAVTNVELIGPPDASFDPGSCTPSGNPGQYVCQPPSGTVSVKAECKQTLPGTPSCPVGYTQQGSQCVAQGGPGACLPGFNYDPALQCCSAIPGADSSVPLPQCPTGTFYSDTLQACAPFTTQGIVSVVEPVGILDCSKPAPNAPQISCSSYGSDPVACTAAGCTFDYKYYVCK